MCDASLRDATAAYDAAFPVTRGFEVSLFTFVSAACCLAFRQPRSQRRAEERAPQRLTVTNLKRVREEWPEAYAQWGMDRAAAGQAQKGSGKRAKGKGKRTCFHCQEEGHVAFACPKKKAGEPAVAIKAKAT